MFSFTTVIRRVADVAIIDFTGRLVPAPSTKLFPPISAGKLIINFSAVTYIDSNGIGQLITFISTIKQDGRSVKLICSDKRINEIFCLVKLYTMIDIFSDESAALGSFA